MESTTRHNRRYLPMRLSLLISVVLVLCVAWSFGASNGCSRQLVDGPVAGNSHATFCEYLGIPYASPPTADLRWRPPQPPQRWGPKVLNATAYGNACLQDNSSLPTPQQTSEDCLYLNVWAPHGTAATASLLPVMFWIHGGGLQNGAGSLPPYNGSLLASANSVIVVNINYRLGALGFLGMTALQEEDPQFPTTGNYGMLDQRAALHWVQENIIAFGGDPKQVTIFGESAGGVSVCWHLVSANSSGLFRAAIIESAQCGSAYTLDQANDIAHQLSKAVGCGDANDALQCLRSIPGEKVAIALPPKTGVYFGTGTTWQPTIDGFVTVSNPVDLWLAGRVQQRVPLLLGSNLNESTLFVVSAFGLAPLNISSFLKVVVPLLGLSATGAILRHYPVEQYPNSYSGVLEAVLTDIFRCASLKAAHTLANITAMPPLYLYSFNHAPSYFPAYLGASHGAEIEFVFQSAANFTTDEKLLSSTMSTYWANFAKNLSPNGAGVLVKWPPFTISTKQYMQLDLKLSIGEDYDGEWSQCEFLNSLVPPKK